jgi:hypothetical protein
MATAPYGFRAIGRIGGATARRRRRRMRGSGGRILQSSSTVHPGLKVSEEQDGMPAVASLRSRAPAACLGGAEQRHSSPS